MGRLWPADGAAVAREYARLADRRKAIAVDSTGTEAETDTLAADETNPETDDALAAFISARKTEVAEITQRADEAEYWSDRVHDAGVDLWEARLRRVVTRCVPCFLCSSSSWFFHRSSLFRCSLCKRSSS